MTVRRIGKGGVATSFIVKKSVLKRLLRGGSLECQKNIDADPGWLQLSQVLQNIPGKGIATMLGKIPEQQVVVKAQLRAEAQSEFDIQDRLKDYAGFVKYLCIFECDGDKEYISRFAFVNDATKICRAKGNSMGVIIMPYYANGSLEDLLKSGVDTATDKSKLVKDTVVSVIGYLKDAYIDSGFTHGDLFTKNILLDANNKPVIIDFEKSYFDKSISTFWRDIDDLLGDVSRYLYKTQIDDACRVIMINRAYNLPPSDATLKDLIFAIQNMP